MQENHHSMKRTSVIFVAAALLASALAVSGISGRPVTAPRHTILIDLPDQPLGPDGAVRLPNGWKISPAGRIIPLPGDMPLKMQWTTDGSRLLVLTGGFHDHNLDIVDPSAMRIVQSVQLGKDWAGLAQDSTGRNVYIAGGGAPRAGFVLEALARGADSDLFQFFSAPVLCLKRGADGVYSRSTGLSIPKLDDKTRWIAGLAAGKDDSLYVVDLGDDTVYRLKAGDGAVLASAKVGYRPYSAAISPDGRTLAVSNWGDASVSLLDSSTLHEDHRIAVGSHPNELAYGPDGRLFVANAGSNSVSVIDGDRVRETIKTSVDPDAPVGSTPDAIAISPDGTRLYVANADNNDVAVLDMTNRSESRFMGFIPTAWYPSALAVSRDGKSLFIGTGKGLGFRANVPAVQPSPETTYDGQRRFDYIGNILNGALAVVPVPNDAQLAAYTREVIGNMPAPPAAAMPGAATARIAFGRIKHVLYIIRENRTYDQVFGDIPGGNGDPSLTLFGADVTPNAHALARETVLLDNLYCNGEVSEDGHSWCDAAYATDFKEKAWPNQYSGRGEPDADDRLTASPGGFLWDSCRKHHVSYYSYGEEAFFKSDPSGLVFTGESGLAGQANSGWADVKWGSHDTSRVPFFLTDLKKAEKTGIWPQFTVLWLPEDHTEGLEAGKYTPIAHVASNDQALGEIVAAVSHSRFWPQTAIFVIEDDAQNGPDHVDAHRTEGLVISPYVRHGYVDHTFYTTASYVRTIELILGLPPMTEFDTAATPLDNAFTDRPVMTAYDDVPARVDLEARNPAAGPGAAASAQLDLSGPDRADPDKLNAILWHSLKPGVAMPAPVVSAFAPGRWTGATRVAAR
jgi:YVTN family beta-propeller protein